MAAKGDIIMLPDGWDIYCIGRNSDNGYWLESRHIETGKLCRDFGIPIAEAATLREVAYAAAAAIEEFEAENDS